MSARRGRRSFLKAGAAAVAAASLPKAPRLAADVRPRIGIIGGGLAQFEYFTSDISIHRDPVYMPERRRHWSSYNVLADGAQAEGSVWYGALRAVAGGQRPLMLFKSWATARREAPRDEVFRRTFRHPLVTPGFIQLQDRLATHQGRAGVWFAGSYTLKVDSQETALLSAMNVVRALDPQAPNLLALES
jgi:predicted NAD/FAD-binding protein